MSELQEIKKDLTFFYTIFIVLFVIFGVVSTVLTANIFNEIHAYNQCTSVDDQHFKACYESAKQ